jgi:hypothetical protein
MYRLVFQSGRYQNKSLVVRQAVAWIGRDRECHLALLDDDQVEQRHAKLEERGTGVYLSSLAEGALVRINGTPVPPGGMRLFHGDQLELGQTRALFQDIIAPRTRLRPSRGILQPLTIFAAIAILLLEAALLAFLVDWPRRIIRPDTESADISRAEEIRAANAAEKLRENDEAAPGDGIVARPGMPSATLSAGDGPFPGEPFAETPFLDEPFAEPPPDLLIEEIDLADFVPPDADAAPAIDGPAPDEDARRLLSQAEATVEFADFAAAFRILDEIYQIDPGFLPAHVQHAEWLELRGNLRDAIQRWNIVSELAPQDSAYERQAMRELRRLRERVALQSQIQRKPIDLDLSRLPRHVRVDSAKIQRLPADRDVADMRVLTIELERTPGETVDKNGSLQVYVTFYDRTDDDEYVPSRAIVSRSPVWLNAPFANRNNASVEVSYVVPRNANLPTEAPEPPLAYGGYAIHVFAGQTLQDALARPRKLLDLPLHIPSP